MTPSPDVGDLTALLARVEAAEGPDRRIDIDLTIALGLWAPPKNGVRSANRPDLWSRSGVNHYCPYETYTASLDAALALCERALPGAQWELCFGGGRPVPCAKRALRARGYWQLTEHKGGITLALVAALLKALIAQ